MAKLKTNKKSEDEVYLTHDEILVINGEEYIQCEKDKLKDIDGIKNIDKTSFKKCDRKDFEKKVEFITSRIKQNLKKEDLIKELIKKNSIPEINKLYDVLKDGQKDIRIQRGCLGIKIGSGKPKTGGRYLQLID